MSEWTKDDMIKALSEKPTHVRVSLRGWRDGSIISTSVRIGTQVGALIDNLESVDLQVAWGKSRRIVSVDGNASAFALAKSFAAYWANRLLRATVLLPLTLRDVRAIKRHWNEQRAALAKGEDRNG